MESQEQLRQWQREVDELMQKGEVRKAGSILLKMLEHGEPFAYGLYQAALYYYNSKELDLSLEKLKAALKLSPDMISAKFLMGKILLQKNEHKQALSLFRDCITLDSQDHESYFMMGKSCFALDLEDEALAFLQEAHKLDSDNLDYNEALGALHYKKKEYPEVLRYLCRNDISAIDREETLTLIHESAGKVGNKSLQVKALERLFAIDPQQEEINNKLQEIYKKLGIKSSRDIVRKRIAIFSSIDSFLGDITKHLEKRFEVKKFTGTNVSEMQELMSWSDLCWFEWCDNLLVQATKLPKTAKIICRMHRYEMFTNFPDQVNWKNVDHLICVLQLLDDVLKERLTFDTPVTIIQNGVNFSKYPFPEQKNYGKKIAYVGYIKPSKGPEMLMQCFSKIHDYDPEYSFHIAGVHQDPEIKTYCDHFEKNKNLPVTYHGWVDDIAGWLEDKDYLLSTSISESFQYAIVEGISRGLLPLVHNWPQSDTLYPENILFFTPDECLELLKNYETSDKYALAKKFRKEMEKRHSLEKQLKQIDSVLDIYLK